MESNKNNSKISNNRDNSRATKQSILFLTKASGQFKNRLYGLVIVHEVRSFKGCGNVQLHNLGSRELTDELDEDIEL